MEEQAPTPSVQVPPKPKKQIGLWTAIGIMTVFAIGAFIVGTRTAHVFSWILGGETQQSNTSLDFAGVQEVYDKLRKEFDGTLDKQKLLEGAKKGLVDAAGDPYTVYLSDEEAKNFLNNLEGKFSGIGAELGKKDGRLVIISTLDDSPARKSGLLANDIVAKVNDQDSVGWTIEKAVTEIRGEKGTTVKLTVVRGQEVKQFSIVREELVSPSVRHEVTAQKIGIMRISRFAEGDTVLLARKAAEDFKVQGVKGVVLDLRGNSGGYLKAAQEISGIWLRDKTVVEERKGDKVVETLTAKGDPVLEGMPTVVLIDGSSASASEIVAGALHDHKAAQLVGVKTFGKGSVQRILEIPSGGQLKVTIAKWFTPNGKNITKEGIEPDVKVEIAETDAAAGWDAQKDKALELLTK